MKGEKPREIAYRILRRHGSGKAFAESLLESAFQQNPDLPALDRGLVQELVMGVIRWAPALDWLVGQRTQGRTQRWELLLLLRLGLYQIFFLDRVPDHAAVHETVELAKRFGFAPQGGFINAVLRGCLRDQEPLRLALVELKNTRPAIGYGHPEWLVDRWKARWGQEATVKLLQWNNTPPQTFARVNTLRTDPARLLTRWREQESVQYDFRAVDWCEENAVFVLKEFRPLPQLGSFQDGWFYIQDPSTLLSVAVLDPEPNEVVLDLCAAPGGKTAYIAQRMRNKGRIVAQDNQMERLGLVRENCARLGVSIVQTLEPGKVATPELNLAFDRILVDAPCSNTGVMRRRVDVRARVEARELDRLRAVQLELLERAARVLKPRGVLVYSTCSLEPEENEGVIDAFLEKRPGFTRVSQRTLTPFQDGVDGAFVARLESA